MPWRELHESCTRIAQRFEFTREPDGPVSCPTDVQRNNPDRIPSSDDPVRSIQTMQSQVSDAVADLQLARSYRTNANIPRRSLTKSVLPPDCWYM